VQWRLLRRLLRRQSGDVATGAIPYLLTRKHASQIVNPLGCFWGSDLRWWDIWGKENPERRVTGGVCTCPNPHQLTPHCLQLTAS
jgi:hypothetical protein